MNEVPGEERIMRVRRVNRSLIIDTFDEDSLSFILNLNKNHCT